MSMASQSVDVTLAAASVCWRSNMLTSSGGVGRESGGAAWPALPCRALTYSAVHCTESGNVTLHGGGLAAVRSFSSEFV